MQFLRRLADYSHLNKLSLNVIAKIFAPILMPAKGETVPEHTKIAEAVVRIMIESVQSKSRPSSVPSTPRESSTTTATPAHTAAVTPSTTPLSKTSEPEKEKSKKIPEPSSATRDESAINLSLLQKQVQIATNKLNEKENIINSLKPIGDNHNKKLKELEAKVLELERLLRAAETTQTQLQVSFYRLKTVMSKMSFWHFEGEGICER